MSPARRILQTLTAIQVLAVAARHRLDTTIPRLEAELASLDGYPPNASGSDSGGHSPFIPAGPNASTSSTERAAIAPDERNDANTWSIGARAALVELQDYLDVAVQALETVIRECDKRAPTLTAVDISRLRCATIPKGACTQWADPTRNDGYCIDHGRIHDRAKRASRDRALYHNGKTAAQ